MTISPLHSYESDYGGSPNFRNAAASPLYSPPLLPLSPTFSSCAGNNHYFSPILRPSALTVFHPLRSLRLAFADPTFIELESMERGLKQSLRQLQRLTLDFDLSNFSVKRRDESRRKGSDDFTVRMKKSNKRQRLGDEYLVITKEEEDEEGLADVVDISLIICALLFDQDGAADLHSKSHSGLKELKVFFMNERFGDGNQIDVTMDKSRWPRVVNYFWSDFEERTRGVSRGGGKGSLKISVGLNDKILRTVDQTQNLSEMQIAQNFPNPIETMGYFKQPNELSAYDRTISPPLSGINSPSMESLEQFTSSFVNAAESLKPSMRACRPSLRIVPPKKLQTSNAFGFGLDLKLPSAPISAPVKSTSAFTYTDETFRSKETLRPPPGLYIQTRGQSGSVITVDEDAPFLMPTSATDYESLKSDNTFGNSSPYTADIDGPGNLDSMYNPRNFGNKYNTTGPQSAGIYMRAPYSPRDFCGPKSASLYPGQNSSKFKYPSQNKTPTSATSGYFPVTKKSFAKEGNTKSMTVECFDIPSAPIPKTKFVFPEDDSKKENEKPASSEPSASSFFVKPSTDDSIANPKKKPLPNLKINTKITRPTKETAPASAPLFSTGSGKPGPISHRSLRYKRILDSMPTPINLTCYACNVEKASLEFSKSQIRKAQFGEVEAKKYTNLGSSHFLKSANSAVSAKSMVYGKEKTLLEIELDKKYAPICKECTPQESTLVWCVICEESLPKSRFPRSQRYVEDVGTCCACRGKEARKGNGAQWSMDSDSEEEAVESGARRVNKCGSKIRASRVVSCDFGSDSEEDGPRIFLEWY
ncbi:hypothetical protein HK098_003353 [Nowakowskiella sp. JEL0407]|nr:hypothetical protein HK098_003353 [Nowakowskiella sp. JEL0407]